MNNNNYKNIMVDLETIATTRDAKLLSIGAVAFDLDGNGTPHLPKLLDDTFYMNVGEYNKEKYRDTFIESAQTAAWWETQGDDAKQVLEADRQEPEYAVRAFWDWARKHGDKVAVWACPPTFDLEILRYHFNVFGLESPWAWWNERCFRTMREAIKLKNGFVPNEPRSISTKDKTIVLVKHNALHDAIAQAYKLQQIVQYMRR